MILDMFLIDQSNFAYELTLIYYIYPTITTEVNVSAIVGMSVTVGEMSATVGECL